MPSNSHLRRRAVRGVTGLALGCLTAVLEMVFVLVMTPLRAVPSARTVIDRVGAKLVEFNRRRLVRYLDFDDHLCVIPGWRRAQSYLVRRCAVGVVGAGILALAQLGAMSGAIMAWQVVKGEPIGGESRGATNTNEWYEIVAIGVMGTLLLFVAVWGLIGVAMLERFLATQYLGPSEEESLRRRVSELATTRAGVVEAVNDERRRIERDLHDGVQQRLVVLGLLLGRALRSKEPGFAKELLVQAHIESQQALHDLRDVTWRVYPTLLDQSGLRAALDGVAERAGVPVVLRFELTTRLDLATETVAYFVALEAVTNALKHGDPKSIAIAVTSEEDEMVVEIRDDGRGGADATGSGLSGLASRVAAADGTFVVASPPGGPTVVTARLPVRVELPAAGDGRELVPAMDRGRP